MSDTTATLVRLDRLIPMFVENHPNDIFSDTPVVVLLETDEGNKVIEGGHEYHLTATGLVFSVVDGELVMLRDVIEKQAHILGHINHTMAQFLFTRVLYVDGLVYARAMPDGYTFITRFPDDIIDMPAREALGVLANKTARMRKTLEEYAEGLQMYLDDILPHLHEKLRQYAPPSDGGGANWYLPILNGAVSGYSWKQEGITLKVLDAIRRFMELLGAEVDVSYVDGRVSVERDFDDIFGADDDDLTGAPTAGEEHAPPPADDESWNLRVAEPATEPAS